MRRERRYRPIGRWSHHPHLPFPKRRTGHEPHDVPYLLDATDDRWEWRRKIREDPRKAFWYRLSVGIAGFVLILLGPITAPLPGPGGTALVLLGLAVWSSEFEWAQRLMLRFKDLHHRYQQWGRPYRVLFWVGVIAVMWLVGYLGLLVFGIPTWTPQWARGWLVLLPGVH